MRQLPTGTLRWADAPVDLSTDAADVVLRQFREWPEADRCLLRVTVNGRRSAEAAATVAALQQVLANRFLHATCDARELRWARPRRRPGGPGRPAPT